MRRLVTREIEIGVESRNLLQCVEAAPGQAVEGRQCGRSALLELESWKVQAVGSAALAWKADP